MVTNKYKVAILYTPFNALFKLVLGGFILTDTPGRRRTPDHTLPAKEMSATITQYLIALPKEYLKLLTKQTYGKVFIGDDE
jgi:hypothetical protein